MIKRVIFDIDDTLIPWEEEYFNEIKKTLDELSINYTEHDYHEIRNALKEYENKYYIFDRKLMIEYINEYTKKQYPEKFIYEVTKKWENCVPDKINKNIIKLLEYLKSKYELVILTDWYSDQQAERLRKLDILKYFSNLYSAEKTKRKPFKEAFINSIANNKPEECIMVGDNFERDIEGALNAGLQAIWYNPKNKQSNILNSKYYTINKMEQLLDIL